MSARPPRWHFWIDRGGTFTDCLGAPPDGGPLLATKLLSSDDAPLLGIRRLMGLADGAPIPPCEVRLGTTLATNALLERRGVRTGLIITRGFGDLLEIGHQTRPDLFALEIQKLAPLAEVVLEVDARHDASGRVLAEPDRGEVDAALSAWRAQGIGAVAIATIHGYRYPELELRLGAWARAAGFEEIALSHQVAQEIGLVGRTDTTVVDAYLTPLLTGYLRHLEAELPGSNLLVMQSSGHLSAPNLLRGKNAILSGPAGGVVAVAHVAQQAAEAQVIGFDMGGTSTDVCRYGGHFERSYESELAGVRLRAPMLALHTVAAGGGSICRYDGHRFTVGPDSAGAHPGPLAYGAPEARSLTITDANLWLGRVRPERFPLPLDRARVGRALEEMQASLQSAGHALGLEAIAEAFVQVANANMAEAIRRVSVARGHDLKDHGLVVFGGAGGQHAGALARLLGIPRVWFHPLAGVQSAYGIGLSELGWDGVRPAGRPLQGATLALAPSVAELEAEAAHNLGQQGVAKDALRLQHHLLLRYQGSEATLPVELQGEVEMAEAFEGLHEQTFGYRRPGHPIEVATVRTTAQAKSPAADRSARLAEPGSPPAVTQGALYVEGAWRNVPLYPREQLEAGQVVTGPAVITEATATIVVDPGFTLTARGDGLLLLEDRADAAHPAGDERLDPLRLELFHNLYFGIAEEMGTVLERTALSTNIRERRDFSCAVFDREGSLVANAPHIPVHLGAMSASIRGLLARHPDPAPGTVYATNDPAAGGSHLPDLTVITPVHDAAGQRLFFVANRGHHADLGGIRPGSMPPFSATLAEEGVVFRCQPIVAGGRFDEAGVRATLAQGPYPARNPDGNVADLVAQIAANNAGARRLLELVERHSYAVISAYMGHVRRHAAQAVEEALRSRPDGVFPFTDHLDDGSVIAVRLEKRGPRLHLDFSGTSPELPGNLNAPEAVTLAAVIYVLRALVGPVIPLNGGCLDPVSLHVPKGCLLSPGATRAVCGGNVETSQRVVDVLLGALGRAAASQGTMNNLTFGDEHFGYYETIAGGAGATPFGPGAHAVHTHMTNTRLTDPEILETRYPVRLLTLARRRGSGGRGHFPGGDGLVRELLFLQDLEVSILSERRVYAPFGLAGGGPGQKGRNLLDGVELGGKAELRVKAGQRLRLETPGGGAYGPPSG